MTNDTLLLFHPKNIEQGIADCLADLGSLLADALNGVGQLDKALIEGLAQGRRSGSRRRTKLPECLGSRSAHVEIRVGKGGAQGGNSRLGVGARPSLAFFKL